MSTGWLRYAAGVLLIAAATVATWWLWLGRDSGYQIDPVTGAIGGPYETRQVVGCVLCLAAIAVVGGLATRPWIVVLTMTVAFTAAWSWVAAQRDDTGLWLVGAILVFAGLAIGTAVLSVLASLAGGSTRRRRRE